MAQPSFKITQISKDFNLKTKDVTDAFKEINIDKKTGTTVDTEEFEILLDHLTSKHQIKNIDKYLSGESKIFVGEEKKTEKSEKPAKAEKLQMPEAKK